MPRIKILVVEDEKDIRELVAFSLENFGNFQVAKAKNGLEAIAKAQAEIPDLILMDVRMPTMTGYEACVRLTKIPETANIPIVFLSAKGQDAEIQQGLDVGRKLDVLLEGDNSIYNQVKPPLLAPPPGPVVK